MTYDSFSDFMTIAVLPLRDAHPEWVRLDGAQSGGNRSVFARFRHGDATWDVHADTHFEPLLIALEALDEGVTPFIERTTERGMRLDLLPALGSRRRDPRHRHMYIYNWSVTSNAATPQDAAS
jgi:hypothetical protein